MNRPVLHSVSYNEDDVLEIRFEQADKKYCASIFPNSLPSGKMKAINEPSVILEEEPKK